MKRALVITAICMNIVVLAAILLMPSTQHAQTGYVHHHGMDWVMNMR